MNDINAYKPKSIIIDGDIHKRFKIFCKGKSMKIGGVIENLIKLYMIEYKQIQKLIDEQRDLINNKE